MDKVIDTRTLVENVDRIVAEAAAGETRFIVAGNGTADVVISSLATSGGPADADEAVRSEAFERFGQALEAIWADVEARGLPPLTMDEIDEEIAAYRREKRDAAMKRRSVRSSTRTSWCRPFAT